MFVVTGDCSPCHELSLHPSNIICTRSLGFSYTTSLPLRFNSLLWLFMRSVSEVLLGLGLVLLPIVPGHSSAKQLISIPEVVH